MTTTQLQYFTVAAAMQSFTRAAEHFFITQTAMTQQIRALEETVGTPLFDRSKRPVTLTPAGEAFLLDARAILARMDDSVKHAREASTGLSGSLRIGYVRGYERSNLSNLLQSFHQQYPNVLLSLYRNATDSLAAALQRNELDLIVTWDSTNLAADPTIGHFVLGNARLVVALYPGHPLARRQSLFRSELRDERLLFMSPSDTEDSYGDSIFLERYRESGYKPNIVFHSSDTESILIMVAAEEGISILPDYCTNKLTNADNLIFLPLEGLSETEEISILWNLENQNPVLPGILKHLENNKAE